LTLPISLKEAVLGAKVAIPLPDGSITVKIPAGSNTGTKMRLKGKGVKGGDLVLVLQVVLDEKDSQSLKKWAKKAPETDNFNPRKALN